MKSLTLELPREFLELCQRDHTAPETVLRGFIADLCSIYESRENPRGYNTRGSDERDYAWRYYDRAGYSRPAREEAPI